jgi:hypothetical protein
MMILYHKLQGDVTVDSHFGECLALKNPLNLERGRYDPHFLRVVVLVQPDFLAEVDDLVAKIKCGNYRVLSNPSSMAGPKESSSWSLR